LDATACNVYIPELISRGVEITHDCPSVQPYVSSTSGQIGDTLDQPGWGFTPGGIAELHFRRPDGSLSPITTEIIQSDGTYNHSWTVTSDAQIGEYQYWSIDLSTGISSPEVSYWIVAPL